MGGHGRSLCGKACRGPEMASHPDGVTCRACRRMMKVPKEFYAAREVLPLHDATLILVLSSWWSEGRAKVEATGKTLSVGQWVVALQEVDRMIDDTLFKYRAEFAGYIESRVRLLVETLGYDELVQMATAVRDGCEDELARLAKAYREA